MRIMVVQVSRCCGSCVHGLASSSKDVWEVTCTEDQSDRLSIEVCTNYERDPKWEPYDDAFGPVSTDYSLES